MRVTFVVEDLSPKSQQKHVSLALFLDSQTELMLMMQTIFAVSGAYYYREYKSNAIMMYIIATC